MPLIAEIEAHVAERLATGLRALGAADVQVTVQRPPRPEMGDFALACFAFAKALRRSPMEIAARAAAEVAPDEIIAEAYADRGFVNVRLRPGVAAEAVVAEVLRAARADGTSVFAGAQAGDKHHVLVEFSSPNTNKPLHLGHVRNNVLGLATCRMLEHAGHAVHKVSLVNDRGIHICKTMLAYQRWGANTTPESTRKKGDHFVGDLYVEFSNRFAAEYEAWLGSDAGQAAFRDWQSRQATPPAAANARKEFAKAFEDRYFNTASALGAETRQLLRQWEAGDPDVRTLWRQMNDWVLAGFDATYRRMGVQFDSVDYESTTYLLGRAVVDDGLARGIFHRLDDGAVVCDYDALKIGSVKTPHKVLLRGDGTTVYTTQDLGTALSRHDRLHFDRMVYVVADEQKHHFSVLFALLGLVRPELANGCHHLAYGMVNLPEGRMKSREGTVVDADNLFDEMAELAAAELRQRSEGGRAHAVAGDDEAEIQRRAEVIAQAAIKFYLLAVSAESTMTFDPNKSIDFLGRTGPYCLNAYARTRQVLSKAGGSAALDAPALRRLGSEREQAVVRALMQMPGELARAVAELDPSKVALATYEVARAFNQLYTDKDNHPIVGCEDVELRAARLQLTEAVGAALSVGLHLLGIDALEQM